MLCVINVHRPLKMTEKLVQRNAVLAGTFFPNDVHALLILFSTLPKRGIWRLAHI